MDDISDSVGGVRDRDVSRRTHSFRALPFEAKVIIVNLVVVFGLVFAWLAWPDGNGYNCYTTGTTTPNAYSQLCVHPNN